MGGDNWLCTTQLAMLVVAAVLLKIDFIEAYPNNARNPNYYSLFYKDKMDEEDLVPMTPQQKREQEEELDKKRKSLEKYRQIQASQVKRDVDTSYQQEGRNRSPDEDIDVVDREDHITQFIADMYVNTDSEITVLQAVEPEETPVLSENEDEFFNFLSRNADRLTERRPSEDFWS